MIDGTQTIIRGRISRAITFQGCVVNCTGYLVLASRRCLVVLAIVIIEIRRVVLDQEVVLFGHVFSHQHAGGVVQLKALAIFCVPVNGEVCVAVHAPGGVVASLHLDEVDAVAVGTEAMDKQFNSVCKTTSLGSAVIVINLEGIQGVDGKH